MESTQTAAEATTTVTSPALPEEGRRGHFPPLDGLRGVAILLVIGAHTFDPHPVDSWPVLILHRVSRFGWAGVNLFFVLSGFLIGGILVDSRGKPGYFSTFYARRSLRIFPLYYAFLLAMLYVVPALARAAGFEPAPVSGTWVYYFYVANLAGDFFSIDLAGMLGHLWSLSVEEQVYLAWPAVIALCPPRMLPALMATTIPAGLAFRAGMLATHRPLGFAYSFTPSCLDAFAAGTLGAILVRGPTDRATLRRLSGRVFVGSALFLLALGLRERTFNFWERPKYLLTVGLSAMTVGFGALIVYLVTSPLNAPANRLMSRAWLRSVGKYSYAIYLFHAPAFGLVRWAAGWRRDDPRYTSLLASILFVLADLAVSYALAVASWKLLERPFLTLKRAFPSRGRGVPGYEENLSADGADDRRLNKH